MSKAEFLRNYESAIQEKWDYLPLFQPNIDNKKESYMITFPFPYMNGRLHMGHALTSFKAECAAQYQRHLGKQVLFPFGFHATGMPIVAASDRLRVELEETSANIVYKKVETIESDEIKTNYHSSKSKLKSREGVTQIEAMQMMGISYEDIPKFKDPLYWVTYFVPKCIEDLKRMGMGIDWSRQFITTDQNPYFDKFVKWQFNILYSKGKLKFGKRLSIWSPSDNQPCQDHDRGSGEGVKPQEYTLVDFEVNKSEQRTYLMERIKNHMKKTMTFNNMDVRYVDIYSINLLAATLRPETMYGLTNIWVHPDLDYSVYYHKYLDDSRDIIIVQSRAASNMKYQGHNLEYIMAIKGEDLLGLCVKEKGTSGVPIYVLPMLQISDNKGTGIVSSVPTESPDDYLNLLTLQNMEHPHRKEMFRKYPQLKDEMVNCHPVQIINIPDSEYGSESAIAFCKAHNIKNPSALNGEKLKEAKKEIYNLSKTKGVFIVPEHNGRLVSEVIPVLKEEKLSKGQWFNYAEPESMVISRSGDVCVVALADQWFIDYGEASWKKELEEHMSSMNMYSEKAVEQFNIAKDWLTQWPCSRTYGLGTSLNVGGMKQSMRRIIIDSLSDSTIYMALYTIYPYLKIIPEHMVNDDVFNYVFLNKPFPADHTHDIELLNEMSRSFNYWYPMDVRVSGKDLIQNHLTFCIYNHIAIWGNDPTKLPKSFRVNGHVTIDGEKMSKAKGNFITMEYIMDNYSSDALRLTMATASSDPLVDTNYETTVVNETPETKDKIKSPPDLKVLNASVLSLFTQVKWMANTIEKLNNSDYRTDVKNFYDNLFEQQIKKVIVDAKDSMDRMSFYEAVQETYYRMIIMKDQYSSYISNNYHVDTIRYYIETFLIINTPFIPHMTELCWQNYHQYKGPLTHSTSIRFHPYPVVDGSIDNSYMEKYEFIKVVVETINKNQKSWCEKQKKLVKDITSIEIVVGDDIEPWKKHTLSIVKSYMDLTGEKLKDITMKDIATVLNKDEELLKFNVNIKKKVNPFVAKLIGGGETDMTESKFDKVELLEELKPYIEKFMDIPITITQDLNIITPIPRIYFISE